MKHFISFILFVGFSFTQSCTTAQTIPASHAGISLDENGQMIYTDQEGEARPLRKGESEYSLDQLFGNPTGTEKGIAFDFQDPKFGGKLYYGFINYEDAKYPLPVFFKRYEWIVEGKAEVSLTELDGKYDMINWEKNKKGILGYRVVDEQGNILLDSRVFFTGNGPFEVDETINLGPFVTRVQPNQVTVSFRTLSKCVATIECNGKSYSDQGGVLQHEILIDGLTPDTEYPYTISVGQQTLSYSFTTSPAKGTRKAFTFSYASDSRAGQGGGERNIYGANAYIMQRIMALSAAEDVAFMQFSGDLINGYNDAQEEQEVEYFNWFKALDPFTPYFPVYISFGNHEALTHNFAKEEEKYGISVDQFPFAEKSAEKLFADFVTNPLNGPKSEDGSVYDPNPKTTDFPSYEENVFSYTYDNVAVIVLNSDYWYSPSLKYHPYISGGLHGYIMDQQLDWFQKEVMKFEKDQNIDHVFVTQHTPFFPNGGHVKDDMWYDGNNEFRPWVAGKPVEKGIIERRDELLDLIVNKSSKVRAIFTGDEHNYAKTEVGPETVIYTDEYPKEKIELSRTIWQINNGSAGAPYYAQEETPWTPKVTGFSTQNVLILMDVEGEKLTMRVVNPVTLELVDELQF